MRAIMIGTGIALAVMASAATAQTALLDTSAISTACASDGDTCTALVAAAVTQLQAMGLSNAELNSQLGILAAAVVESAKNAPSAVQLAASRALAGIAQASGDPQQRAAIMRVAELVARGQAQSIDTRTALAASSN